MIAELLLAVALQVPAISNPSGLYFVCPDHDQDTQHEVDVIDAASGVVVATLLAGDTPAVDGRVLVSLSVQPIKFGQYRFVVRAVAGGVKSENSAASDPWLRSPGKPTGLVIK